MNRPREESLKGLIIIARAVRARGLKGELVADILTDFPARFEDVSKVHGVGPIGQRKELELEGYWFQNKRVVLKFAGYDNEESANGLVGFEFGVPEGERVKLSEGEFYNWELEGCVVESEQGLLVGGVIEVMRTGGVELLLVRDDRGREHLIPMTQAIVTKVDVPNKKILIDPPEGLLDL